MVAVAIVVVVMMMMMMMDYHGHVVNVDQRHTNRGSICE